MSPHQTTIVDRLTTAATRRAGSALDGVYFDLHGAMSAEGILAVGLTFDAVEHSLHVPLRDIEAVAGLLRMLR